MVSSQNLLALCSDRILRLPKVFSIKYLLLTGVGHPLLLIGTRISRGNEKALGAASSTPRLLQ